MGKKSAKTVITDAKSTFENNNEIKTDRFREYINSPNSHNLFNSSELDSLQSKNQLSNRKECLKINNSFVSDKNILLNQTHNKSKKNDFLKLFEYDHKDLETNIKNSKINKKIKEVVKMLNNNDIILVTGDTGCGKTTIIPRMLMEHYNNIVCTQPRKLAAINVAKKVAHDLNTKVGDVIGYSVRFDSRISDNTRLRFVTDGILLMNLCYDRQMENKLKIEDNTTSKSNERSSICTKNIETHINKDYVKGCFKYDLVIIDEAHERSINIDLILAYFRMLKDENKLNFKVIIMSATLNTEKFIEYFNCPIINIHQKKHSIEYFYLKNPVKDYFLICVNTAINIAKFYPKGDILVFLTGQTEIEMACKMIEEMCNGLSVVVLKLHSTLSSEEQDRVFQKTKKRKIILSTNIAETSVTIEGISFVVDSGKVKQLRRSKNSLVDYLEVLDISQDQAKQRAGRSGRTGPGIVFRIYTSKMYSEMSLNVIPEFLRSNLSSVILYLKAIGIPNILMFKFIDSPLESRLKQTIETLYYLKALDINGNITNLGRSLSILPVSPELGVSLYAAYEIGCLNSVAIIAAFLEVQNIFLDIKPDSKEYKKFKIVKNKLSNEKGIFYTFINIFREWQALKFSDKFLRDNYLNISRMHQTKKIREQLLKYFKKYEEDSQGFEIALCAGFFMKVARKYDNGYMTIFGNIKCQIHPQDDLYKSKPKYVLFYDLMCINTNYMYQCIEIDEDVLMESVNKKYNFLL